MKTNDAFVLRNIYGKHILMPVRSNNASNEPVLLNEVAAYIWNAASKQLGISEILRNTAQYYNLKSESPELMAVKQFIEQMATMGLLIASCESS